MALRDHIGELAMPVSVGTLPPVDFDYTNRGPGLHTGMSQLETKLAEDGGRKGHLRGNVTVPGGVIPIVLARSDLYVLGFQSGRNWFRFDDADWPFTEAATKLGYDGQYSNLGGLVGSLTLTSIKDMARLGDISRRPEWNEYLRTLLVVVSECARLIPVRMQITGLLNSVLPTSSVPLAPLAHYIQNWDKASKGKDMSQEVGPNQRTGFKDPTIIKR
jgi:hypothetical protein